MKFAIVSDTHDNTANFSKVIDWLNNEKIELILHCGDICNQTTIDEAVKQFKGEIKFVRGNGDFDLTLNHEMPFEKEVSGLSSKFGPEIRNNFQAGPLAKPENSIKFPSAKFRRNTSKAFRDSKFYDIPETMELELGGNLSTGLRARRIFFNHYPDVAKKMAESRNPSRASGQEYDLVFYGHTHKPWEEKVGECRLVNPGELAGQRFKPTFAIYDTETDKLELKILEKL